MLVVLYLVKNAYLLFEYNIQYKFVYGNMFELQRKMLDIYLHRPYEYFLKAKSGELIRSINNDVGNTFSLLITLLGLFTEIFVSGMLVIAVFMITPVVTSAMAVIMLILLIGINFFIKPILRKSGKDYKKANAETNKWMIQAIEGIKDLKVMHKEGFFVENFTKYGRINISSLRKNQILGITPRFLIEAVSMSSMFLVVAIMVYNGVELETIVPILSAVAMAAIRLLPSVNRISNALTAIAYTEPMVDTVIETLDDLNTVNNLRKNNTTAVSQNDFKKIKRLQNNIEFKNISYAYPATDEDVLEDVSIKIKKGESVGIVGNSGAGKTTTVDLILGLLKPHQGQILIDGVDIYDDMDDWLAQIGYIPQSIFMLDDSIRANVAFGVLENEIDNDSVWAALKEASLDKFVKDLPDGLDTMIGERGVRLSGGQRQRIGIARALYTNPEVLFFDEATSALDDDTEAAILESINSLHGKKTLVNIAHRKSTIESCDHIFRVANGKIVRER